MNLPSGFRRFSDGDVSLVASYASRYAENLTCCYVPANIVAWADSFETAVREDDGLLWLADLSHGGVSFPLGRPVDFAEVAGMSHAARTAGLSGEITQVPEEWAVGQGVADGATHGGLSFGISDDESEYLYLADDLAEFPGSRYSPKRNLIHQFESHAVHSFRDLDGTLDFAEVSRFVDEWSKWADGTAGDLPDEMAAMKRALASWGTGLFSGVELRGGDGRLLGVSIWSRPSESLAVEHFEKSVHDVKGASQVLLREAARRMRASGAKWINREQDMGVDGLRKSKRSYLPAKMLRFGRLSFA